MSVANLHASSSFLFWTIITISARWHPTLSPLYSLLVEPYRVMLGSILVGPIHELPPLHGIILLCFWPLAIPRQKNDPSWNLCGLLTNAGLQMGLQNSAVEGVFTLSRHEERERGIRAKTWMACVQINST
jgi:hypothetical protein